MTSCTTRSPIPILGQSASRARGLLAVLPLALSLSCSEQRVSIEPGGYPILVATPDEVVLSGVCSSASTEVTISNHGDEPLFISDAEIDGDGWSFETAPTWPATIDPGRDVSLTVAATGGEATLLLRTNDPNALTAEIPLSATANGGPAVQVQQPAAASILLDGEAVSLIAEVVDPDGATEGLVVTWTSDVDGAIGTSTVDADGMTQLIWEDNDRTTGTHVLSAVVQDTCGNVDGIEVSVCQDGLLPTTPSDYLTWQYQDDAYWDLPNQWIHLTDAAVNQVGVAMDPTTVLRGAPARVEFDFWIGGGDGAHGLALLMIDRDRVTNYYGGAGACLGYATGEVCLYDGPPIPGWALEIDTSIQGIDPVGEPHLEFVIDGELRTDNIFARTFADYQDDGWHTASVILDPPLLQVSIDDVLLLNRQVVGDFDFDARLAFSASTGLYWNRHLIRNVTVDASPCRQN